MAQQTFAGVPAEFTAGEVLSSSDQNLLRNYLIAQIKEGMTGDTGEILPMIMDLTNNRIVLDSGGLEFSNGSLQTVAATSAVSPIIGYKVDTSNGNYSTTSTSFVDVDTTNARVAVTTPAGCTAIACLLSGWMGNTGGNTTWQVNTTAGTNRDIRLQDNSYWTVGGGTAVPIITGLTASTAYNIDWQFKCSGGTTNIYGDSVRPRMVVIAL